MVRPPLTLIPVSDPKSSTD